MRITRFQKYYLKKKSNWRRETCGETPCMCMCKSTRRVQCSIGLLNSFPNDPSITTHGRRPRGNNCLLITIRETFGDHIPGIRLDNVYT